MNMQRDDGLFNNYANDSSTFADASSAALVASTVYRTALLTNSFTHLPHAESVRQQLWASNSSSSNSSSSSGYTNDSSTANMAHFTSSGWLTPVVNPNSFSQEGSQSPEGQAFVVMMYAAWRDWVDAGSVSTNVGVRTVEGMSPLRIFLVVGVLVVGFEFGW